MVSKEIGRSAEYYMLYEILRKIKMLTQMAPNIGWNGGGQPTTTTTTTFAPTTTTTTTTGWNPFIQITDWDFALNQETAEVDLASSLWTNVSLAAVKDGNALVANGPPSWDASQQAVLFEKANNDRFTVQAAVGGYAAPLETWWRFRTPTAWLGSQHTMVGFTATHNIAFAATTGAMTISGASTGFTPSLNTEYLLRVVFNGASSHWTINNSSQTAISLSTNAFGTPNWRIGAASNDTLHWAGWLRDAFVHDGGLSAGQVTNMWAAPKLSGY